MKELTELENKLHELEMKVTFQDYAIETLNDVISKQDKEILKLWDANRLLKQSLSEAKTDGNNDAPEPPPPHY